METTTNFTTFTQCVIWISTLLCNNSLHIVNLLTLLWYTFVYRSVCIRFRDVVKHFNSLSISIYILEHHIFGKLSNLRVYFVSNLQNFETYVTEFMFCADLVLYSILRVLHSNLDQRVLLNGFGLLT